MKSTLKFKFNAGFVGNKSMKLLINQQSVDVSENFIVDISVELPTEINFELSGKLPSDTVVENGKIIADKFIQLDEIEIDGFKLFPYQIPEKYLETSYWGENGLVKFIIDQDDPALWLLECPKII